jgi:hypothetical protein
MRHMTMTITFSSLLAACALPQDVAQSPADPQPSPIAFLGLGTQSAQVQAKFDARKADIEALARGNMLTWVEAATQVRDLDQELARRRDLDSRWKYDYNDEEYHAFCIAAAALVDSKRISFAEYDAARTRRFSEIAQREKAGRIACTTQIVGTGPFAQLVTNCR